ncbi:hypothetical protein N8508_00055 [bacterium]|nr:hypothetical protein [bacterium]
MSDTKKYTVKEFLNTISISTRDKWVAEKIYAKDKSLKTLSSWERDFKIKCKGINYKKIN